MNCSIANCGRKHYAKGLCQLHWQRWRKHGDPNFIFWVRSVSGGPREWIRKHAAYSGDVCLTWPFAKRINGYPKMGGCSPARMMCELAHGAPPNGDYYVVAHNCGKGHEACLAPNHLRWATVSENHLDKRNHGTATWGQSNAQSKLTDVLVRKIRELASANLSHSKIEKELNGVVTKATISRVISRKIWWHVA